MNDLNIHDIHTGETERIPWIKFDTCSNNLFNVDHILEKYPHFWKSLEIFCVADCCGLDAFRFYPYDIANASKQVDKILLKEDISKLKLNLISSEKDIIISSTLNNLVDKTVFVKLLDHISKNL